MKHQPPKWIERVLEWYCHPDYIDEIKGDLYESFWVWEHSKGRIRAQFLFAINTFLFLRMYNSRFSQITYKSTSTTMLGHFLKVSVRNFKKHKSYNLANIIGLTAGITISLIMSLHIKQELSYEKSYPKHDRIARVAMNHEWAKSSPVFAEELQTYFPELEAVGRFARYMGDVVILSKDENKFISNNVFQADQPAIQIFDFEFVHGNPAVALKRPNTALITEAVAGSIFGNKNPVGETINVNGNRVSFEITGVIRNLPENSHLKADMFVSMPTFYENIPQNWLESRSWMVMYTYALMPEASYLEELNAGLGEFQKYYLRDVPELDLTENDRMATMRLTDIHLKSDKIQEMGQNSNIIYIYVFGALAAIIILIAAVNFVNIFTTLTLKRTKEVGLRKVIGANRKQLITQLLSESVFSTVFATILGIGLCLLALPFYNTLVDLKISVFEVLVLKDLLLIFAGAILLGLISGLYPAWLVTGESITSTLSSGGHPQSNISFLRKGLIVFQFMLSLFILIGTVAIERQMNFINTRDVGYDADEVTAIRVYGELYGKLQENRKGIFSRLRSIPGVKQVGLSSDLIGDPLSVEGFRPTSATEDDEYPSTNMMWVDENYIEVMGIELVNGRNFHSKQDTSVAFIVNQKLVDTWGEYPMGKMARFRGETGPIVGIMEDYNYYSLRQKIEPMALCYKPSWAGNLLVKTESAGSNQTMVAIEEEVRAIAPSVLFYCNYLDDKINGLYKGENAMFRVFRVFTILALVISCVGLLGLAAIEVQRRTKEVGIRKVLGASGSQLLSLLSRQFIMMIALSVGLGVPLSYIAINEWLANFSYQITLSWWIFAVPSLVLLILALLVVAGHVTGTVKANPVNSLRYE